MSGDVLPFCVNCGAKNDTSSRFCFDCGARLEATSRPAPAVIRQPLPAPDDDSSAWQTQARPPAPPLGPPNRPSTTPATQRRRATVIAAAAAVIVLAAGVFVAVLLLRDRGTTPTARTTAAVLASSAADSAAAPTPSTFSDGGPSTFVSDPATVDVSAPSSDAPFGSTPVDAPTTPVPGPTVVTGADGVDYPIRIYHTDLVTDCAAHAYGTGAIDFLTAHPCVSARRLIGVVVVGGRSAALSIISVTFGPGDETANQDFVSLENASGTGGMNDLLKEGDFLPGLTRSIPSTEAFVVDSDDLHTIITDSWWLRGRTDDQDPALVAMAEALHSTDLVPLD